MAKRDNVAQVLVGYALGFMGQPYRWGGDDPINGFDCSGLIQEILAGVGLDPEGDQTADAMMVYAQKNWKPCDTAMAASVIFFGTGTKATHVGFGLGDGLMMEAGGGGAKTLTLADAAAQNAFVRMRPVARRRDVIGIYDPIRNPLKEELK